MRKAIGALLAGLALLGLLTACERAPAPAGGPQFGIGGGADKPRYRLAVHPLHNPKKLVEAYQPLVDYLNRKIPEAHFELEASRDYQAYEQKLRARTPEFLLPNPWQTLEAIKVGYSVIAMAGDAEDFKGLFIVRRDSDIKVPADLKGKAVSYPSHTALAACVMPQDFLRRNGIDIRQDIRNHYVGSQESSIMNVYLGKSAAGATWPPPWRLFQRDHPREAAALKVVWETPPLLNNSFMVRDDVPSLFIEKVQALLVGIDRTDEGKAILAGMETARFHPASNVTYDRVRNYIATFERDVRPIEQP